MPVPLALDQASVLPLLQQVVQLQPGQHAATDSQVPSSPSTLSPPPPFPLLITSPLHVPPPPNSPFSLQPGQHANHSQVCSLPTRSVHSPLLAQTPSPPTSSPNPPLPLSLMSCCMSEHQETLYREAQGSNFLEMQDWQCHQLHSMNSTTTDVKPFCR